MGSIYDPSHISEGNERDSTSLLLFPLIVNAEPGGEEISEYETGSYRTSFSIHTFPIEDTIISRY